MPTTPLLKPALIWLIHLVTFHALQAQQQQPVQTQKPNIIFILVDDFGYGDLGLLFQNQRQHSGEPYERTPNLDKMGKEGVLFTQQYCNAPVCAPSRASLITGVNQGNTTVRDNQFDKALEDAPTMATVLKNAGYATCIVGKWGLQGQGGKEPADWPAFPLNRGFDHFMGYARHSDGHEHYPHEGLYRGKKQVWLDKKNITEDLAKCYTTDLFTAYAKKWITQQNKSGHPFFLYLAYDVPHAVLELPTQAYPAGGGLKGGLQWLGKPGKMINTASGTIDSYAYPEYDTATYDDDRNPATAPKPWPATYVRHASSCRRVDDAVGDIMQLLKDLNIDNNTLIVFTSDNGPSDEDYLPREKFVQNKPNFFESYGPMDGIKRDCWEGGIRVPTIVRWPAQIPAGKTEHTPSMLSDWLATFSEMAHTPAPARTSGVSLLPQLTGKGRFVPSNIYIEYLQSGMRTPDYTDFEAYRRNGIRGQMQMLRIGKYIGVRYNIQSADDDFEIYDAIRDPKESNNLAPLPEYRDLQITFKAMATQNHGINASAPRPYDSAYIAPVQGSENLTADAFDYTFYPGRFKWVVNETALKAAQSGRVKEITGKEAKGQTGMLVYTGYVQAAHDGEYEFSLTANAGALVKLHQINIMETWGNASPQTGKLFLKKGMHPLKVYILTNKATTIAVSVKKL